MADFAAVIAVVASDRIHSAIDDLATLTVFLHKHQRIYYSSVRLKITGPVSAGKFGSEWIDHNGKLHIARRNKGNPNSVELRKLRLVNSKVRRHSAATEVRIRLFVLGSKAAAATTAKSASTPMVLLTLNTERRLSP